MLDIKLPSGTPINYNKIDFYSDLRFHKISKYIRSVYKDDNISSKLFTISRIYIQDRWIERSEAPDLFTRFETVSKTHKKITSEITYYFYFNPLVEMYAITPTTPSPLYSSSASSRKRSTRRQKRTRKLRH